MSKGGSSTNQVTIPEYIEAAAQRNLNKAERISQIGYTPYYGPDVAAFTPMQQASFQNTADTAGAFGMAAPTSQQDIMGGMAAPTTYANGVQGYSSAPMFEESLAELGRQRPGQKAYIDSFFIDPFTGGAGSNNFAPIDYTQYGTMADQAASNQQHDLNMAAMQRAPSSTMTQAEIMQLGDVIAPGSGYNPVTDTLSTDQQIYVNDPANVDARIAQEDINASILGNANNSTMDNIKAGFGFEPTFENPSSAGSYGGSLVTGGLSGDLTPIPGLYGNAADKVLSSIAPGVAISQQGKGFAESGGSTYNPDMVITNPISGNVSSGGYDFDPTNFSSDYGNQGTTAPGQTTTQIGIPGNFSPDPTNVGDLLISVHGFTPEEAIASGYEPSFVSNPETVSPPAGGTGPVIGDPTSITDLRTTGSNNSLGVNTSDKAIKGAVSDNGNWQQVVNPGTNAITRTWVGERNNNNNNNNDETSDNDGTVMCTAYCEMGYLPREIWKLDRRYGVKMYRNDPTLIEGYHMWGVPVANYLRKQTFGAKVLRAVMWPIVKSWAEEMAHNMKPEKYKPNYVGKLIKFIGEPFSRMCGKLKSRKIEEMV